MYERLTGVRVMWGRRQGLNKGWLGTKPYVLVSEAATVEPILNSPKYINKSSEYIYLRPWLGTGLLTSSGKKWKNRRKILTPAFHFKILDNFVDIFFEHSHILVNKMKNELGKEPFNIFPYVTLCTLDIICETAMGRKVNAQSNSDSEYVKAIYEMGNIILNRQSKIWMQPNWIFKMTNDYVDHQRCLKILHDFSYKVIRERKEEIAKEKIKNSDGRNEDDDSFCKKKLAFLDLLIEASKDGAVLSTDDIREEVDTFMFEGHDTTSAGLCWCLYLLGCNQKIQQKVADELDMIFDGDADRKPTMKELFDMKYLECCIKEALRLFPSVPLIARYLKEDVQIGDYLVPAGTTAMIITHMLHRDPKAFPNPEVFDPDRFLPENCRGRHPYAYIPFSAGPRNCIGQRFAILEEKTVLSTLLRKYRVESTERREDITLLGELILRPKNGLQLKIYPRRLR
ncbi:cytochrome P450 4c3 isoform X2 [Arctopsyche grandis]